MRQPHFKNMAIVEIEHTLKDRAKYIETNKIYIGALQTDMFCFNDFNVISSECVMHVCNLKLITDFH